VKITKVLPKIPEATYDITGLTRDEIVAIRDLVGKGNSQDDFRSGVPQSTGYCVYQKLNNAIDR
jgi:hypothetical protein